MAHMENDSISMGYLGKQEFGILGEEEVTGKLKVDKMDFPAHSLEALFQRRWMSNTEGLVRGLESIK